MTARDGTVPPVLRSARFVRRQPGTRRAPMRVTPRAFELAGLPVPEDRREWNIYRLTERRGEEWSPAVDKHIARFGGELLPGGQLVCIDCDQQLAIDGEVWRDGLRWLTDAGAEAGQLLDITRFVSVRTPGDRDRMHGPGWHLWARSDPEYPVRSGALKRCAAVEIKSRATAPGSPGYEVRHAPAELPVVPRWIAELAGPPREPTTTRHQGGQVNSLHRLEGILTRLIDAGPGDHRNDLLHWSACRCGEMIAADELDAATAEQVLYRAAEDNGHVAKHGAAATLATIRSGLRTAVAA
jgi:hypothetical protein